jgi:hypothetical protein
MWRVIEGTREMDVHTGGGISCITNSIVVENIKEDGISSRSIVRLSVRVSHSLSARGFVSLPTIDILAHKPERPLHCGPLGTSHTLGRSKTSARGGTGIRVLQAQAEQRTGVPNDQGGCLDRHLRVSRLAPGNLQSRLPDWDVGTAGNSKTPVGAENMWQGGTCDRNRLLAARIDRWLNVSYGCRY